MASSVGSGRIAQFTSLSPFPQTPAQFLTERNFPDFVVFLQSHPGQFAESEIQRLRSYLSIAPMVTVLSSLCEGETRTGHPILGVNRSFWHQWPAIAEHNWNGRGTSWGLPGTASDPERFLSTTASGNDVSTSELVIVIAQQPETASAIGDICHVVGYSTTWVDINFLTGLNGAYACVVDAPGHRQDLKPTIERLRLKLGSVPIIVLVNFPRRDDCEHLVQWGASAVLAKPYLASDLWQTLKSCYAASEVRDGAV